MYLSYFYLIFLFLIPIIHSVEEDDDKTDQIESPATQNLTSSDEANVNHDIYDTTNIFKKPPKVTDINDFIQTQLYCEVDDLTCHYVEKAFISAAEKVYNVINFKKKIIFQTSYYSFCINACANSTYGWGQPSSQFTLISLDEADANFIYPQALAKQLAQFTDSPNWANVDVTIDINHDIFVNHQNPDFANDTLRGGYWFNQTNVTIEENQVDLEYVLLHEMVHGLGMVSSWAPYFSDRSSPFQKLLNGLITPEDSLKIMTPSPYWYITHLSGPTYLTGFKPNLIFDKSLELFLSSRNETVRLMDDGFEMQNFCVEDQDEAFIVYFMHAFLNNATQSTRAKRIYVAMSEPETLWFRFESNAANSAFWTDPYLNMTYDRLLLMTGPEVVSNSGSSAYYQPGTSHVDSRYVGTADFLMTYPFVKGKTLAALIEEGYEGLPDVFYNVTFNVTLNFTRLEVRQVSYRSAIGPGILRILETLGYSTVLTNTNYTLSAIKTNKPETTCDDTKKNTNYQIAQDMVVVNSNQAHPLSIDFSRLFLLLCFVLIMNK